MQQTQHIVERIDEKMLKGQVTVRVTYPDGREEVQVIENRIVSQGRDFMVRNVAGVNTVNVNYIVFSNSNTAVSDTETSVPGTWVYGVSATKSQPATKQVRWTASLDGGASGVSGNTIYSIALATGSNGSGEFSRVVLSTPINLGSGVTVNVQYDVTIS